MLERLGLQGAVEPRLAGEEHVGPGPGRVAQEVVARAAGDRHPLDRACRDRRPSGRGRGRVPVRRRGRTPRGAAAPGGGRSGRIPIVARDRGGDRRRSPAPRTSALDRIAARTAARRVPGRRSPAGARRRSPAGLSGRRRGWSPRCRRTSPARGRERAFGVGPDPPGAGLEGRGQHGLAIGLGREDDDLVDAAARRSGRKRDHVDQAEPVAEAVVDPAGRAVEGRVRAGDRDARPGQQPQGSRSRGDRRGSA